MDFVATDGWHRATDFCVFVRNGLVTKYYDAMEEMPLVQDLEQPCRLDAFRARLWRKKKRDEKHGNNAM